MPRPWAAKSLVIVKLALVLDASPGLVDADACAQRGNPTVDGTLRAFPLVMSNYLIGYFFPTARIDGLKFQTLMAQEARALRLPLPNSQRDLRGSASKEGK